MGYEKITRDSNVNFASGGYKNVFYFAPRADFDTLAGPIAEPANPGDEVTVAAVHTFLATKGFISYACKTHSVNLKGESVGDDGAREIQWTTTFIILGDSASKQEQLQKLLNDDVICLLKDAECGSGQYIQLGDDCVSPEFSVAFDGKTTKEGKKEYTVTVICKRKYFYSFAVTEAA